MCFWSQHCTDLTVQTECAKHPYPFLSFTFVFWVCSCHFYTIQSGWQWAQLSRNIQWRKWLHLTCAREQAMSLMGSTGYFSRHCTPTQVFWFGFFSGWLDLCSGKSWVEPHWESPKVTKLNVPIRLIKVKVVPPACACGSLTPEKAEMKTLFYWFHSLPSSLNIFKPHFFPQLHCFCSYCSLLASAVSSTFLPRFI